MNRLYRSVSTFLVFAFAMLAFTSSAFAFPTFSSSSSPSRQTTASSPSRPTSASSQQSSNRSSSAQTVMRYRNGTTVTYANGMRFIQPHGKHAQPMIQRRDAKGRWMKAEPAKTWGPPASAK